MPPRIKQQNNGNLWNNIFQRKLDFLPWNDHDPHLATLDRLPDGVQGRQVGVDGADVPQEGRHGGVVVILERKPRKNRLLITELDTLTFLESLGNTGPRSVGRPDSEGQRVVVGLISWSDDVGPDASHVIDCVHVEVDEDHHEAGHVPCTRLHFGFSSFLDYFVFLRIWKIQ